MNLARSRFSRDHAPSARRQRLGRLPEIGHQQQRRYVALPDRRSRIDQRHVSVAVDDQNVLELAKNRGKADASNRVASCDDDAQQVSSGARKNIRTARVRRGLRNRQHQVTSTRITHWHSRGRYSSLVIRYSEHPFDPRFPRVTSNE